MQQRVLIKKQCYNRQPASKAASPKSCQPWLTECFHHCSVFIYLRGKTTFLPYYLQGGHLRMYQDLPPELTTDSPLVSSENTGCPGASLFQLRGKNRAGTRQRWRTTATGVMKMVFLFAQPPATGVLRKRPGKDDPEKTAAPPHERRVLCPRRVLHTTILESTSRSRTLVSRRFMSFIPAETGRCSMMSWRANGLLPRGGALFWSSLVVGQTVVIYTHKSNVLGRKACQTKGIDMPKWCISRNIYQIGKPICLT